jgi:D-3-phosphoglycerate dehydrogenase / 2-oxoglutarate reductase
MAGFLAVLIEHGYASSRYERDVITAAGGEFVDAQDRSIESALDLCRDADGILVRRLRITAEIIRRLRRCRTIVRYGVGTDNIDIQAATEAGIIVGNVPDYCIDEVSAHAIALLLDGIRDVTSTHQKLLHGAWDVCRPTPVHRIAGKTMGLVGLGQIGSAVARKLSTWGLRVIASDPFIDADHARLLNVELTDLDSLCRQSDYISLHLPLLPETHHLLGRPQFGLMKEACILVNTSRGAVIDTQVLLETLDRRPLFRAALDVFEEEPLPADSPFRKHPQVVLTDHMAWYSEESQVNLQVSAARSLATVCSGGLPGSLANPEVLVRLGRFEEWTPAGCMRWQLARSWHAASSHSKPIH